MEESETIEIIKCIVGDLFKIFQDTYPVDKNYYHLDVKTVVISIQDAVTDINRVGSYCSKTGANKFKKAVFISKRIAEMKPIQVTRNYPVNLTNENNLTSFLINIDFALFCLIAMLGCKLYPRLTIDIKYCFTFRSRMDGDSYALLLEHALVHSQ